MTDYAAAREAMVDHQVRPSDVTSYPILQAMLKVPRERFVPSPLRAVAYAGEHLRLSEERVLLDPRIFSKMLEASNVGPDDLVLDVGCGLGYSAAVLSRLAGAVVALESDEGMARSAEATLTELEADNVVVARGPLAEGAADHAPYNLILVEGGAEEIPPALIDQLREGGRMIVIRMERPDFGRCHALVKAQGRLSGFPAFEAAAPVLPGFARARAFEF